jgi:hypothetical protein
MRGARQCRGPAGTTQEDFWLTAGAKAGLAGGNDDERVRALTAPVAVFLIFLKHGRHFSGKHSHLQIESGSDRFGSALRQRAARCNTRRASHRTKDGGCLLNIVDRTVALRTMLAGAPRQAGKDWA